MPDYNDMTPDDKKSLYDVKMIEKALIAKQDEFLEVIEKAGEEGKIAGEIAKETSAAVEALIAKMEEMTDRMVEIEQKGLRIDSLKVHETIGDQFIKTDQFKALANGSSGRARMDVKVAIINAQGQNQPLVAADRLDGINTTENRILQMRDIIPASSTISNLVEFVRENVFTNAANIQGSGSSPFIAEDVLKPESGITFVLMKEPVQTLAHFIPASKQVLEDSASLSGFIAGRLTYGLKLKEEAQLLFGDPASNNGDLNGLMTLATAYVTQSPASTNKLDIIRDMIKQAQLSEYTPDYIVLNPQDWYDIDVQKVGTGDDRYVVGDPRNFSVPRLWGIPVVVTNSMLVNQVLVGSFQMGCEIKDRKQSSVEVSREHSDNFTKNMVTVLAEERIALVTYRTESFIKASL